MPMQFDLTGKKFHKLRVIKYLGTHEGQPCQWLCECDCGKIMTTKGHHLRSGNTKSCGCMQKGKIKHGHTHRLDGKRKRSPEYQSWQCMKSRCTNKNRGDYKHYGGRGIRICERWLNSFENFLADMGNRPAGKTLDRKDNDGDYSLENCVWSTRTEQTNNKRDCIFITYKNEKLTVKQCGRKLGINADYIYAKIRRGKSHIDALLCVIDRFNIKF